MMFCMFFKDSRRETRGRKPKEIPTVTIKKSQCKKHQFGMKLSPEMCKLMNNEKVMTKSAVIYRLLSIIRYKKLIVSLLGFVFYFDNERKKVLHILFC